MYCFDIEIPIVINELKRLPMLDGSYTVDITEISCLIFRLCPFYLASVHFWFCNK